MCISAVSPFIAESARICLMAATTFLSAIHQLMDIRNSQFLTITNKVAINMCRLLCEHKPLVLWINAPPKMQLLDQNGSWMFCFLRACQIVFQYLYHFIFPSAMYEGSIFCILTSISSCHYLKILAMLADVLVIFREFNFCFSNGWWCWISFLYAHLPSVYLLR